MRVAVVKARSGLCDGGDDCFADGDGDGYHDGETTVDSADLDCTDAGELDDPDADGDCDDGDPLRNPGVDELPGDNVDQARPEA